MPIKLTSKEVQSTLREIMQHRLNWLNIHRVAGSNSWAMPEAIYSRDPAVQAFLRGPATTMALSNFSDKRHACNYSRKHRNDQKNASFNMRAYLGTVTITKTRDIFTHNRGLSYHDEARALSAVCGEEFVPAPSAPAPTPAAPALAVPASIASVPSAPRMQLGGRRLPTKRRREDGDIIVIDSD